MSEPSFAKLVIDRCADENVEVTNVNATQIARAIAAYEAECYTLFDREDVDWVLNGIPTGQSLTSGTNFLRASGARLLALSATTTFASLSSNTNTR
jgi:hypothetical protein